MENMTLSIVSIIVSAFSAMTAFVAVFVTLWQTKWPYRISLKLKAHINDNKYQTGIEKYIKVKKLFIQFQNVGFNDASILSWGIKINKHLVFNAQYFGDKPFIIKSKTIEWISIPLVHLQGPIKNIVSNLLFDKRIKLFVTEVGGKTFTTKIDLKVKQIVNMVYSDFESTIPESEYEEYCMEGIYSSDLRDYLTVNGLGKRNK